MGLPLDAGTVLRGATAGAVAGAAWAAAEPVAARALGTDYTDVRLLGRMVTERGWVPAGIALHVANGAAFGAAFAVAGGRGPRAGATWALTESVLVWPGMALLDRVHPDRRSGRWPRLLTSPRIFLQETLMHGLFGVVLGLLLPKGRS